jgi:hypothetical protein
MMKRRMLFNTRIKRCEEMLNQLSDGLVKEAVKDSLEEIERRQKQNEMHLGGIEMLLLTAIRRLKK